MKERILFVALGGGAGNIGIELQKRDFNVMYINTSNDDLKTLNIQNQHQILHIPGSYGCSKNRKKAQLYVINNANLLTETIDNRYPTQNIVYFLATLGGGTGSGSVSILADAMIQKNPDKHYGLILVLPSIREGLPILKNTVEAYGEITKIEGLKKVFVLDNGNIEDRFEINREFADRFDKLVNITIPDARGIVDPAELEEILTTEGNSIINVFDNLVDYNDLFTHNIFTAYNNDYKNIGLLIRNEKELISLEEMIDERSKKFVGYNEEYYLCALNGMPFPHKRIEEMIKTIERLESNQSNKENFNLQIPKFKSNNQQKPIPKQEKLDFSRIFEKYSN